jgi:hypothetical protein
MSNEPTREEMIECIAQDFPEIKSVHTEISLSLIEDMFTDVICGYVPTEEYFFCTKRKFIFMA